VKVQPPSLAVISVTAGFEHQFRLKSMGNLRVESRAEVGDVRA